VRKLIVLDKVCCRPIQNIALLTENDSVRTLSVVSLTLK